MAGETLRIAIVGTGSMAQVHAAACADVPGVVVAAVVGRTAEHATALAASVGAAPFTDLDAMLASTAVDVVDCCLPTPLHRPTVEWAVSRKLHVICEKPLALTLEDGRAMIAACRQAGVQLLMAQVLCFFSPYERLAGAIRSGTIGTPVIATLSRQGFFPSGSDLWFRDIARSGGIFVDMMTHDLFWALEQFGPPERVFARLVECVEPRPFAQAMATVRHRSGMVTHAVSTWGHPGPFTTAVEVSGSGGLLQIRSADTQPLQVLAIETAEQRGAVPLPSLSVDNPFRTQLAHFAEVLAGRATPRVRAEMSLAALNLALAARTSASIGRAVPVQEVEA